MLEAALEQLLLQFLTPYVDGISKDKLHLGVFRGSLELKDLRIKPDALVLLGFEGFRVRSGNITVLKLTLPWSTIYSGKLRVDIAAVRLEVEQIELGSSSERSEADLLREVREAKRRAVDLRLTQLRNLLEQLHLAGPGATSPASGDDVRRSRAYGMRLVRKILNNIHVTLADVRAAYVSEHRGFACGLELPLLHVLSTDQTFKERPDNEEVVVSGLSMYKLLKLRGLGVRISAAGSSSLEGADYLLTPISADLQLAQVPSDQIIRLRLEVATKEIAEVSLRRSQAKHLRRVKNASVAEAARLQALLVPPEEEYQIYINAAASKAEYGKLYERCLLHTWRLSNEQLTSEESKRLQLLEDALSIRLLARQRWLVCSKVEALNSEVARRQREAEKIARMQGQRSGGGFMQRVADFWAGPLDEGGGDTSTGFAMASAAGSEAWLTPQEREQLLRDVNESSEVETVDLPERFKFEFVLGKVSLDLVDDRWSDDAENQVRRQLLSMALQEVHWVVDVHTSLDHLGRDTLQWSIECSLSAFRALHSGRKLFRVCPHNLVQHDTADASEAADADRKRGLPWLDGSSAAKLQLGNDPARSLLSLRFEFAPMEVHLLPGALEKLLEFVIVHGRSADTGTGPAPTQLAERSPLGSSMSYEEVVDQAKDLMEVHGGERAKEVAARVCEQLPERLQLDVRVASPIVHVPVKGLGTAVFSLGHVELATPQPCMYNRLDLAVNLTQTSLRALSARGECFNMVEPVPVQLNIQLRGSKDQNSVDVQVMIEEELGLTLTPQALRILLATPQAIADIMAETEAAPTVATPTVHAKQSRFSLKLGVAALDVTLADSAVPTVRVHVEMPQPGLLVYAQAVPKALSVDCARASLECEVLNTRSGAWEPLVEHFSLSLQASRTRESGEEHHITHVVLSGQEPMLVNITPTTVQRVSWIVPQFIAVFAGAESQSPDAAHETLVGSSVGASGMKYRVVNLCGHDLELDFKCRHRDDLRMIVKPTGSLWEPLDEWIVPHFATAVAVRVPGGQASEALLLERSGVVLIPDSGAVAEVLPVLGGSSPHRLLLLAPPLRLHNRTDLTFFVRFHDAVQREVLLVDVPATSACDAALLGHDSSGLALDVQPQRGTGSSSEDPTLPDDRGVLLLLPNAYCAVPALAVVQSRGTPASNAHTWLSIRPASLDADFCAASSAGAGIEAQVVRCPGNGGARDGLRDVNLIVESATYLPNPSAPIALTTVVFQPALTLMSGIPIGSLTVALVPKVVEPGTAPQQGIGNGPHGAASSSGIWQEVTIPRFARLHLYNFPGPLTGGLSVRVRLEDDAPWSASADFHAADFLGEGADTAGRSLAVYQSMDGAAANIAVEPLRRAALRFSCPCWLVDRGGLSRPLALELRRGGRPLPSADGLTLLPADCLEVPCELAIRSAWSTFATRTVRMPPSWSTLPWTTPCGSFVFCLQTDDVVASDVLGAQCQVITLRPRLVLTNVSDCCIELSFEESRVLRMAPGQSMEWHWHVKPSDEDPPSTALLFRPLAEPPCSWSGAVVCSDSTAGSTPFTLQLDDGIARSSTTPGAEVWSIDIAPVRGALAVSFRRGSDYVACNRAHRAKLVMLVRPLGSASGGRPTAESTSPSGSRSSRGSTVVMPGQEAPYGWTRPFHGGQIRSVDVLLQGRTTRINDVRRTMRHVLPVLGAVLAVTRVGTRTLLTLEDHDITEQLLHSGEQVAATVGAAGGSDAWLTRVEAKLSSLGISFVEEQPQARELLYCHLDLIRLEWRQNDDDVQQLKLSITEAQVDCQLPGRVDARTADLRRRESLALLQQERPGVIFANCASGDSPFLSLFVRRSATSSNDLVIPCCHVAMDALDITVDDGWLDPLVGFMSQACAKNAREAGASCADIAATAGQPIVESYQLPPLPPVVQVDSLHISAVQITTWCNVKLSSVGFLPAYVRTAIRLLSFSGRLTLDDATLSLQPRMLPPHRGSLSDFLRGLISEYTINLLNHAASFLVKSSVLNLPRAPIHFGRTSVSYVSDTIGLAAGEAAALLTRLTFDDDYVMQQHQLHDEKQIRGVSDGVVEAVGSLAQGVGGLFDVVLKPMEGARRHGMGGFFAGLAPGVAGTFVKPISKVGQAIADVGSGIAATMAPETASMLRRRARVRHRLPRLLFSELGVIRPWCELEAQLFRQLGRQLTAGVECVVPLTQLGSRLMVLMLFARRFIMSEVAVSDDEDPRFKQGNARTSRPADFLAALDETGLKLALQALKPINTLVYGVQDIERHISGRIASPAGVDNESAVDPVLSRRVRGFSLSELRAVHTAGDGDVLQLEDARRNVIDLPLIAAPIGPSAKEALLSGFRSALGGNAGGIADWAELYAALTAERRQAERAAMAAAAAAATSHRPMRLGTDAGASSSAAPAVSPTLGQPPLYGANHGPVGGSAPGGAGQRTLEVFEVERWSPTRAEWVTPFLPADRGLSWRWVDATGVRHPHLDPTMSRREIASQRTPPCRLSSLFHSTSEWLVDINSATDKFGWRYGLAWNASHWDPRPGLLEQLRRRHWTRTYA